MITMAPPGAMRTSAIGRSALFGAPYCARNVGLCKPRWPANARDLFASLHSWWASKNPPPPMPDCSPGRASRWLLLLPRRTVQADSANPRCRLAGARRPCAVVLEGVLACRRAAPSVVVVHVPSATPRSCAWATCSRTCLHSTPFVRQDLALPSPPKSCMAALKLACKGGVLGSPGKRRVACNALHTLALNLVGGGPRRRLTGAKHECQMNKSVGCYSAFRSKSNTLA